MATPMTLNRILAETAEKRAAVREALSKFGASLTGDDSEEDDQDDESGSQQVLNIVAADVGFASDPEYEAGGVAHGKRQSQVPRLEAFDASEARHEVPRRPCVNSEVASTQRWLQSRDVSLATANSVKIPCAFK